MHEAGAVALNWGEALGRGSVTALAGAHFELHKPFSLRHYPDLLQLLEQRLTLNLLKPHLWQRFV